VILSVSVVFRIYHVVLRNIDLKLILA